MTGVQTCALPISSRAEFRTLLRQDNADLRLTEISYKLGLASQQRMDKVVAKKLQVEEVKNILDVTSIEPLASDGFLKSVYSAPLVSKQKASQLLLRPDVTLKGMIKVIPALNEKLAGISVEVLEQAEIQIKYEVYIEKEKELVGKMRQLENLSIPDNFNYEKLVSLSNEAKQKFKKIQPRTLGQASRISGVNPSDVQILMVYMGR